jgi:tripartite-type tricarboxylate transporter receptor subunit TctC
MRSLTALVPTTALCFSSMSLIGGTANADPVADFYRNGKITVVLAGGPGAIHSIYTQLLAPYVRKHMPGNPSLVVNSMPGAGGTIAANYLYNVAPKDGGTIGSLLPEMPMSARFGTAGNRFDPLKFSYLAGADVTNSTITLMRTAGVSSIAEAREKVAVIAAGGPGSQTFITPTVANAVLGTKFKVVTGYNGLNAMDIAVDRGEAHGRSGSWSSIKATRPHWLTSNLVVHLAIVGPEREPDLPDVPLLTELAATPQDRAVLSLISDNALLGRMWLAPPGVPEERVTALREAFWKALNDPELIAEAKAKELDLRPVPAKKLAATVEQIMKADDATVDRLKSILASP